MTLIDTASSRTRAQRPTTADGPGLLGRFATAALRNRGKVLAVWVAAVGLLAVLSGTFGGAFSADYRAPGSDSSAAAALLRNGFPSALTRPSITIVARADGPVTAPAIRARVDALREHVALLPHVASVSDPWISNAVSASGRGMVIDVALDVRKVRDMPIGDTRAVLSAVEAASGHGLTVAAGGDAVSMTEHAAIGSEAIGLSAGAVILLLTFGTALAAGIPLVMAVAGLFAGSLTTVLVAAAVPVPDWSTSLVAMLAAGLSLDYALLLLTQFRRSRAQGLDVEAATAATFDTAGRTVLLAGVSVIVSMLGLAGMGLSFMRGAAVVTIAGVVLVLLAAFTLFPAVLGYAGPRLDRRRLQPPATSPTSPTEPAGPTVSAGWLCYGRLLERHRRTAAVAGLLLMLGLAVPILGVHWGTPDAGNDPSGSSTRRAYDMATEQFGPGVVGPLLVVLSEPTPKALTQLRQSLDRTPGVASVAAPVMTASGDTALITLVPSTSPQDDRTAALVRQLRRSVLPAALTGTHASAHVGGVPATTYDSDRNVLRHIPVLLTLVLVLSLLLLLVAFRSVAIAVKGVVLNLLSVAAAYGAVALVCEGGWLGQLIGIDHAVPVPTFVPVLMFAVLSALSADYEIMLLSSVRAAYTRSGDTATAVSAGLAGTARVITAAAAIMISVFAAFIPSSDLTIKVIGVGMASAILIDATVVRLLLVPALMHLLGEWNWWMPAWLERFLPRLAVEHDEPHVPMHDAAGLRAAVTSGT